MPGEDLDSGASLEQSTEGSAAWCDPVQSQVESGTFAGSHGTGPHRRRWDRSLRHLASKEVLGRVNTLQASGINFIPKDKKGKAGGVLLLTPSRGSALEKTTAAHTEVKGNKEI